MDIGEPEKANKRKKNKKSRSLYFYPKQSCLNLSLSVA